MKATTTITNRLGLPEPIVEAIRNDDYDPGDSDFTVTELIGPARQAALVARHGVEEDASERIYSLLGQAVHSILERANVRSVVEKRLYHNVLGVRISGKFDHMALLDRGDGNVVLQDYKVASVWEYIFGLKDERVAQLNALAWLAELHGYRVTELEAVLVFRDWRKREAAFGARDGYPQQQVARVAVPRWPADQVHGYLRERVQAHLDARERALPDCTDAERWAKPTTYAVVKVGNKRASRVLDSELEAQRWGDANVKGRYEIQVRAGEQTRCALYCPVATRCEQWARLRPAVEELEEASGG